MSKPETRSGRSPTFRLVDTIGERVFHILDGISGCSPQDHDEDSIRRCRLLVATTLVIFLFAQFFLYRVYAFEGFMSPTVWVFVCGSGLMLLNLPLLRWTRSSLLLSQLLVSEIFVSFGLMAYYNGGSDAASLLWNLTIPLLAVALVGPGFGLLCTGLIIAEIVMFYVLTQAGYPFPHSLTTAQNRWFHVFGSIDLIICVALAGWFYEVLRQNALAQVEQAHRSLEKSEAYFRSLIENGSDFIAVLNANGTIRYSSPSYKRLLGYSPNELRGKNALDLADPGEHPQLQECLLHSLRNPTDTPSEPFTFHFRHRDGSSRVLEGIGMNLLHDPAVAGLVINSRDITERQRVEEALRDSEQRYRSVVESAPEVIFMLTPEGILTALNPAFETLIGWSREQFLGQPLAPIIHPDDLPQAMEYLHRLVAGEILPLFELRLLHQQGNLIFAEITITPQIRNDRVISVLGIAHDITHRKEVERLKNELVSTVSHELRTPLASLRGFTELMLSRDFPPAQQREFLAIIQKESIRLTNLINDFLDLERIASGRQVYNFATVALEPLLQEAIAVVGADSARHPCHLELSAPLPRVQGDVDRLRQVLLNLLTNAIKYSPHGGAIRVGARHDNQKVVLWVADHGIGIPVEARTNLFKKFYRVDNVETRQIGGTGLGLSLVQEIVQAHGGEVWVESEVGVGSTFFFSLPALAEELVLVASPPVGNHSQSTPRVVDIAIVANDPPYTRLLQERFTAMNLVTTVIPSAQEALSTLRQITPRLVLIDIHLKGQEDGWDLLITLKNDPFVSPIPVMIISSSDITESGLALDGAEYLLKPVSPTSLKTVIQGGVASSLHTARKKRVLVVDDDPVFQRRTATILTTAGHEVEGVSNGKDALAHLAQKIPDVLILDLALPDVDGFTILRKLREDRRALHLKVIVVTGKVLAARERDYIKQQLASVVNKKTHDIGYLVQTIHQALENRPSSL